MAKQIGSIQFKGKIGETVGFTGMRGQAFLRKTNSSVKNPRTTGQNVQRMILATVGTSIGHLSEVLNSSVQGKSRGAETLAYLRGEWMRQLRVQNIFDASNTLRYAVKGYSGFTPNPYILSKGTLYGPATTMSQQYLAMDSDDLTAPNAVKTATQLFPTIALGDQITLIACYKESGAAPYYNEQPISVAYLRFAFKNDNMPALITAEDNSLRLNPDAIDLSKAAGAWRSVIVRNDGTGVGAFDMTRISRGDIVAGALLVSNLEGNKRSTSYLAVDPNANLYWSASVAEPTFGNNSTPLDFASEIYLNNSAVIGEEEQSPALPDGWTGLYIQLHNSGDTRYDYPLTEVPALEDGDYYTLVIEHSAGGGADILDNVVVREVIDGQPSAVGLEQSGDTAVTTESLSATAQQFQLMTPEGFNWVVSIAS